MNTHSRFEENNNKVIKMHVEPTNDNIDDENRIFFKFRFR